jgi:hypothetical protein
VAAHPARADERRVEHVQRDVAGADEVDLLLARARRLLAQAQLPDPLGDDVERVEERVQAVRDELARDGRVVDAVHHDEQLVQRQRAAAAHAGDHELVDRALQPPDDRGVGLRRRRGAHREQAVAPLARLDQQVAVGRERAVGAVEEVVVDGVLAVGLEAGAERLAAHADRVDLVDEDDALSAPLGRELLRLAGEEAHDHGVHADERLREAGAWDRHERAVERCRDRLRQHRLAGARRAEEQHAALALAAGLLELLARLPERDDAGDLLLRLGLPADVVELDAPVGIARLVALDLLDAERDERAEEDQEVDQEQRHEVAEQLRRRGEEVGHRGEHVLHRRADPFALQDRDDQRDEHEARAPEGRAAELLAPVPEAPARDDVVAGELRLRAVDRRGRDQAVREHVDEPAEDHDCGERGEHARVPRPVERRDEQREQDRARQQRDRRREPPEPFPLACQRERMLVDAAAAQRGVVFPMGHCNADCKTAEPAAEKLDESTVNKVD